MKMLKKFILLEEGPDFVELLSDIVENEELVDKTKWEKGNKWGKSVI